MAGIDPVLGFVRRTLEDIIAQLEADEIAEISPALDVSASSPMGQINGIFAKHTAELWDLGEAIYVAGDPDRATGDGQDAIAAITGTTREPARKSRVSCNLTLGATVTVPIGSLISLAGNPSALFQLVDAPVVSTVPGTYPGEFEATETGPLIALAGTLTVIVTPVSGWTFVTNPLDAVVGADVESSSALRTRREAELAAPGSTPVDALRAELYKLMSVANIVGFVDVIENDLDTVDADGRPGHSVEALIDDGFVLANDDIAQVIWDGKAGGIQAFGSTTGNAIDDLGVTRVMNFNRPSVFLTYFAVSIVIDPVLFPLDGDTQIKQAMVAQGRTLRPGDDVARAFFFGPIFSVPGVQNVTVLHLSFSPGPTLDADLVVNVRQRATFDTSRITVAHV